MKIEIHIDTLQSQCDFYTIFVFVLYILCDVCSLYVELDTRA